MNMFCGIKWTPEVEPRVWSPVWRDQRGPRPVCFPCNMESNSRQCLKSRKLPEQREGESIPDVLLLSLSWAHSGMDPIFCPRLPFLIWAFPTNSGIRSPSVKIWSFGLTGLRLQKEASHSCLPNQACLCSHLFGFVHGRQKKHQSLACLKRYPPSNKQDLAPQLFNPCCLSTSRRSELEMHLSGKSRQQHLDHLPCQDPFSKYDSLLSGCRE